MGYGGLWLTKGMGHEGFDCSTLELLTKVPTISINGEELPSPWALAKLHASDLKIQGSGEAAALEIRETAHLFLTLFTCLQLANSFSGNNSVIESKTQHPAERSVRRSNLNTG